MNFNEHQMQVLEARYLKKDDNGNIIETPDEMFWRVAKHVALAEKPQARQTYADKFYWMMSNGYFLPNTPTLINAGNELGQLSACFVIPVGDSIEEIFDHIKNVAIIHKTGGGTGTNYSELRPEGALVSTTKGEASGPISFMRIVNEAIEQVKQGGVRRGAKMGILNYDHPDIMKFIKAKTEEGVLNNFNLSVAFDRKFFDCLESNGEYELVFGQKVYGKVKASEIFDLITKSAWNNGEPGFIFLDRINEKNTVPGLGRITATNPCGEQPLLSYESCNLGSVNLFKLGDDEQLLREVVRFAIRFLDDVIDVNEYPLEEIHRQTRLTRKIGLGVMGWADFLYKKQIPYDSDKALEVANYLMKIIDEEAVSASSNLARARGNFPAIELSIYQQPMRNATMTTIAPTGSISIIAGCSSGIEPNFALCFKKKVVDKNDRTKFTEIEIFNPALEQLDLKQSDLEIVRETGSLQNTSLPKEIKTAFKTAIEIDPMWHLYHQATFQIYTHNAVSKTINLPNNATVESIKKIFLEAHKMGCKGLTVYRVGSRNEEAQIIGSKHMNKQISYNMIKPAPRPKVLYGATITEKTGCGKIYVTLNNYNDRIFETFVECVDGGCPGYTKGFSVLLSILLRCGIDTNEIVRRLKNIYCPTCFKKFNTGQAIGKSCPDIIARIIESYCNVNDNNNNFELLDNLCPECKAELQMIEGCVTCPSCGYSKCK